MYEDGKIPAWLNTKQDYANIKRDFPKAQWKERFQRLKDNQKEWLPEKDLASIEDGIENQTHRIVVWRNEAGEIIRIIQEKYQKDPSCRLNRLGFIETEIDAALEE